MSKSSNKKDIYENHINTPRKNIYKMDSYRKKQVDELKNKIDEKQKEHQKKLDEKQKIIDEKQKQIDEKRRELNIKPQTHEEFMENVKKEVDEKMKKHENENKQIEPTVVKKQRKPRQPRGVKEGKSLKQPNAMQIKKLYIQYIKLKNAIYKDIPKVNKLKTLKGQQKFLDKLIFTKLKKLEDIKNMLEPLLDDTNEVMLSREYNQDIRSDILNSITDLLSILEKTYDNIAEPIKPIKIKADKKQKESVKQYFRHLNLLTKAAGYAVPTELTVDHAESVGVLSYVLKLLFPDILKYNAYKLKKNQVKFILDKLKEHIDGISNEEYTDIIKNLKLNEIKLTYPVKKHQKELPILDDITTIYSGISTDEPKPSTDEPKPSTDEPTKPRRKKVIETDDDDFYANLKVIPLEEGMPNDKAIDKKIVIKRKPKTPKPVKKKYTYKEIKEAKTIEEYVKNGFLYKTIQYKDGYIQELKPQPVIAEEEEEYIPQQLTELDRYVNKISLYNTDEIQQEFIDRDIKFLKNKNKLELIEILKKQYIKQFPNSYNTSINRIY
jgi:hypothetical protein